MSPRRVAQLCLAPGPAAPGRARRFLEDTCRRWTAADFVADAALVVSELVTNAVRHAGTEMRVALELRDGALTVSVHDGGPGLPRIIPVAERSFGGRGLAIVVRLAEAWGVAVGDDGGKAVWCRLRPRAAVAAGAAAGAAGVAGVAAGAAAGAAAQWVRWKGGPDAWSA
jgi:anti-sigma regulatory factor (Ser/Thr protein kinase)